MILKTFSGHNAELGTAALAMETVTPGVHQGSQVRIDVRLGAEEIATARMAREAPLLLSDYDIWLAL